MLPSERLAIAAHLHVLLRRRTGRVTDTEWMAQNAEYATEIVRFARARAREDQAPELAEWADKLEQAVLGASAPRASTAPAAPPAAAPRDSGFAESVPAGTRPARDPNAPRYVGGIR